MDKPNYTGCVTEKKKRGQSGIDKASPQGAGEIGFISEEGGEGEEEEG